MDSLDKWAAEKVGFNCKDASGVPQWQVFDAARFQPFTLSDARCREIVREYFKIETELSRGFYVGWTARTTEFVPPKDEPYKIYAGKTLEEAELLCIAAIREGEG
jgi:hypothetical protein